MALVTIFPFLLPLYTLLHLRYVKATGQESATYHTAHVRPTVALGGALS